MLPAAQRLTRSEDFATTIRRGQRAGRRTVVAHLLPGNSGRPARAGLVVSRAVGGSVVRNRVSRRLRHLLREELDRLPAGTRVVVRAQPAAADAAYADLRADLSSALRAASGKAARTRQTGSTAVGAATENRQGGVHT